MCAGVWREGLRYDSGQNGEHTRDEYVMSRNQHTPSTDTLTMLMIMMMMMHTLTHLFASARTRART